MFYNKIVEHIRLQGNDGLLLLIRISLGAR
jgi:hypothetical protein